MIPAVNDQAANPAPIEPETPADVDADFVNGVYEVFGSTVALSDITNYTEDRIYTGIGMVGYYDLYDVYTGAFPTGGNPTAELFNDALDILLTGSFTLVIEWYNYLYNFAQPFDISDGVANESEMWLYDNQFHYFWLGDLDRHGSDNDLRDLQKDTDTPEYLVTGNHAVAITRTDLYLSVSIDGDIVKRNDTDQETFAVMAMTRAWLMGFVSGENGDIVIGRMRIYATPLGDEFLPGLSLAPSALTAPSNQYFSGAQTLVVDAAAVPGRTLGADDADDPTDFDEDGEPSVWYKFVAPATATYTIYMTSDEVEIGGAAINGWVIDIFNGGPTYGALSLIDTQYADYWPLPPAYALSATSGTTYWFKIHGDGGGAGRFEIALVTGTIDSTAPTITSSDIVPVVESTTLSHSLTAGVSVTWEIVSGEDMALFEIVSGSTLRFLSNGTHAIGSPADADSNNMYEVIVKATNTDGFWSTQAIKVLVTDASGWFVAYTAPTFATNGNGLANTNTRQIFTAPLLVGGTKMRITYQASSTQGLDVLHASVGKRAVSGNTYDYNGGQVAVTFDTGSAGFSVGTSATKVSDEVTFTSTNTDNLVFALHHNAGTSGVRGFSGSSSFGSFFQEATGVDKSMTSDVTMSFFDNGVFGITKIEVKQ